MAEYIELDSAVAIADYAVDEHPYDKDPARPETYSDYNQGWNDACDYIRGKLEATTAADAALVRHVRWRAFTNPRYCGLDDSGDPIYRDGVLYYCSECGRKTVIKENYCPKCGAKMDLEV